MTQRMRLVMCLLIGYSTQVHSNPCEFSVQNGCTCTSNASLIVINCRFNNGQSIQDSPLINSTLSQKVVVQILDLSRNNLTSLPLNFFQSIASVNTLDLSYNLFPMCPPLLDIMKNITVLNLSHNQITVLDSKALNERSPVRTLDMSHNKIDRVDVADNHTLQLYILNLSHNFIQEVPDVIWKAADSLHLDYNRISSLPFIPESQIKYIYLEGNQLTTVKPYTFNKLHYLDELYLSHNQLKGLKASSFVGAWALTEIDLENNFIPNIDEKLFKSLPNLITIKLSQNKLTKIEKESFQGLEDNLQWLSLRGNQISNISLTAFAELENLRHLDLSDNPTLRDINKINFPPHLASLDLSNCNLQRINDCKFAMYRDLQFLGLSDNNLTCSCQLSWLYKWQKHMRINKFVSTNTSLPNWMCFDPSHNLLKVTSDLALCENMTEHMKHCRQGQTIVIEPDNIKISLAVSTANDVITASWSMESDYLIHGFIVTYETKDDTRFESPLLQSTTTRYVIKDMEVKGSYTVCVHALFNETYTMKKVCKVEDSDFVQMIVGILAGIVFIIPCIVALIYILYKDHKVMQAQEYKYLSDVESPHDITSDHKVKVIDEVKVSNKVRDEVKAMVEPETVPPSTKVEIEERKLKDSPDISDTYEDVDVPIGGSKSNEAFVSDCGKSHGRTDNTSSEVCEECHQKCDNSEEGGHFLTKL